MPAMQSSEPMDIKEEKKEEEEDGVDIRDKIRNAFGDDSDSDWGDSTNHEKRALHSGRTVHLCDRLEHHWSILYICVTCVAIREENKKAWKSGLRFWNINRRVRICYWCICLLSVCCPSVVRPLSVECLFVVYRMSVCCLFVVRLLSVCYPSIVCGPCVVRPLSVRCLSVFRPLCVCGQSVAVCDNTQHLNETESETFPDTKCFPISNPILFSILNPILFLN